MIDFEYTMNTYEQVVYELGQAGMTDKDPMLMGDILTALQPYFKSKIKGKNSFNNTFKRTDYFLKQDVGVYIFSQEGYIAFQKLDKIIRDEVNHSEKLSEFFRVFLKDEILQYTNGESPAVEIKYSKIEIWDLDFAEQLITDPATSIEHLENTLYDNEFILNDIDLKRELGIIEKPKIEIINLPNTQEVEQVRKVQNLGKFVQVHGRTSLQNLSKAQATITAFQCMRCDHITYVVQSFDSKLVQPQECENEMCGRNGPFRLMAQPETIFVNTQIITIESPKGQVDIKVALQGHQCEPPWVRDGKVVKITGQLLHTSIYLRSGKRSDFEYLLLANSIRLVDESQTLPPSEEEIEMFEEWAKDPEDLRYRLVESIAPYIHGYHTEKTAISLSYFSDWSWYDDPTDVVVRSSIHVLLLGDPGVAKSQLVKDALRLAPKGKFAQIVSSTPGGLANSAIQKDGEWYLKGGIFSHADQGVMGLDEIDKFKNKDDVNCLINVLEDQYQVVSKAGITEVHFNGRTAVLATANPSLGNFNRFDPIMDQTNLPLYIMQRFDLVFIITDIPNKEHDTAVARAIYEQHKNTHLTGRDIERVIDVGLFKKYIIYARSKPVPELPEKIEKYASEYYLAIRGRPNDSNDPLITARSLNNLYRVARALARQELASCITETHIKLAISLIQSSIQSLAFGMDDHSVLSYGSTKSQRERISEIRSAIKHICINKDSATIADIVFIKNLDETEVTHTIQMMKRQGELIRIGSGYRLV